MGTILLIIIGVGCTLAALSYCGRKIADMEAEEDGIKGSRFPPKRKTIIVAGPQGSGKSTKAYAMRDAFTRSGDMGRVVDEVLDLDAIKQEHHYSYCDEILICVTQSDITLTDKDAETFDLILLC